jgi:glycosyltransferase involved in cell wall biosynthesis
MSEELAILVPVLGRPHRVAPLLESIRAATPDALVVFLTDPDDGPEHAALADVPWGEMPHALIDSQGGNYAEKINRGVVLTDEPYVFTGADDLHFHAGWLEAALTAMADGVEVVGVNDLLRRRPLRRGHATHFLLTREYANRPCIDGSRGPCSEVYRHNFVDDELIATATARGVYAYAPDAHVEHLHWMNQRAEVDATYEKGRESFEADRLIFEERQALWA